LVRMVAPKLDFPVALGAEMVSGPSSKIMTFSSIVFPRSREESVAVSQLLTSKEALK